MGPMGIPMVPGDATGLNLELDLDLDRSSRFSTMAIDSIVFLTILVVIDSHNVVIDWFSILVATFSNMCTKLIDLHSVLVHSQSNICVWLKACVGRNTSTVSLWMSIFKMESLLHLGSPFNFACVVRVFIILKSEPYSLCKHIQGKSSSSCHLGGTRHILAHTYPRTINSVVCVCVFRYALLWEMYCCSTTCWGTESNLKLEMSASSIGDIFSQAHHVRTRLHNPMLACVLLDDGW